MSILIGIEDDSGELVKSEMLEVFTSTFCTEVLRRHYGAASEDIHTQWLNGWIAPADGNIVDYYNWVEYYGQRGIYRHPNECNCSLCTDSYTFGSTEANTMLEHLEQAGPPTDTQLRELFSEYDKHRKYTRFWEMQKRESEDFPGIFTEACKEIMDVRKDFLTFLSKNPGHRLYGAT